jgi:hypothetical protein
VQNIGHLENIELVHLCVKTLWGLGGAKSHNIEREKKAYATYPIRPVAKPCDDAELNYCYHEQNDDDGIPQIVGGQIADLGVFQQDTTCYYVSSEEYCAHNQDQCPGKEDLVTHPG